MKGETLNIKPKAIANGPIFLEPFQVIISISRGESIKLIGKGPTRTDLLLATTDPESNVLGASEEGVGPLLDGSEPPPKNAGRINWADEVDSQKWMNFYANVLTRFAGGRGLKNACRITSEAYI